MKRDMKKQVKKAAEATEWNPMKMLGRWGIKSSHAYAAGLISSGFSMLTWCISRKKKKGKKRTAGWSMYFGQCAASLFAIGLGLKQEEKLM